MVSFGNESGSIGGISSSGKEPIKKHLHFNNNNQLGHFERLLILVFVMGTIKLVVFSREG